MKNQKDLLKTLVDLLDGLVEVCLAGVIEPLLILHGKIDHTTDRILGQILESQKGKLPRWILQQGTLTHARIALALPMIVLLSWEWCILAALLVVVVLSVSFWERALAEICSDHYYYCPRGCGSAGGEQDDHGEQVQQGEDESFGKFVMH